MTIVLPSGVRIISARPEIGRPAPVANAVISPRVTVAPRAAIDGARVSVTTRPALMMPRRSRPDRDGPCRLRCALLSMGIEPSTPEPALRRQRYTVRRYICARYIVQRRRLSSPQRASDRFAQDSEVLGGAADDQLVTGGEDPVHGCVRVELARAVAHDRHDVDATAGEVGDGLSGQWPVRGDLELLDAELELPVRKGEVDEVGDARPRRELGDLATGTGIRRDRPVGARLAELRLGALLVRAGHDEQLRVQGPRRERHVDI